MKGIYTKWFSNWPVHQEGSRPKLQKKKFNEALEIANYIILPDRRTVILESLNSCVNSSTADVVSAMFVHQSCVLICVLVYIFFYPRYSNIFLSFFHFAHCSVL